MTIHVNIGKAKAELSRLIAASLRGEEVVIDKDGVPQVRLAPIAEAQENDREECNRRMKEIIASMHALPLKDGPSDLEWDDDGLPI